MKKLVIVFLLFIIYIPVKAQELVLKSTKIEGKTEVKVGEKFTLSLGINFEGFNRNSYDSEGIMLLVYQLNFDDDVLDIVDSINSNGAFQSEVYKTSNNTYLITSQVTDLIPKEAKCINPYLFCNNYKVDITFYPKKVKKASISIGQIAVGVINLMDFENNKENLDNLNYKTLEGIGDAIINLNISEAQTPITNQPESIIKEQKADIDIKEMLKEEAKEKAQDELEKENTESSKEKSSNNNLKVLEIENYNLNFQKDINLYDLEIENNLNSLQVKVETEDEKATYKIIGADNLKENNYKIIVQVTAENGDIKNYTISLKNKNILVSQDTEKKELKLDKKYLILGASIIGGIFLFSILIFIILKIKDTKLEKKLKNL